jgi:hypothetical protein
VDSQRLGVDKGGREIVFDCQINAKSHTQYGSILSDFLDPILIIPSRTIKMIIKILMRASSVAAGLTIYIPLSMHLTIKKAHSMPTLLISQHIEIVMNFQI